MVLPISRIVNVSININSTGSIFSPESFSDGIFLDYNSNISSTYGYYAPITPIFPDENPKTYYSYEEIVSDGWLDVDSNYVSITKIRFAKAANVWFAQNQFGRTVGSLKLGVINDSVTHAYVVYNNGVVAPLATFKSISSGSITLTINGTATPISSIDLSTATSLANVAQILDTYTTVEGVNTHYYSIGGKSFFYFTGSTGGTATLSIPSQVSSLYTALGGSLNRSIDGKAVETIVPAFEEFVANSDFFHVLFSNGDQNQSDAEELAAYIETLSVDNPKMFYYCTNNTVTINNYKTLNYNNTTVTYNAYAGTDFTNYQYTEVAYAALISTSYSDNINSVINICNKSFKVVQPDDLNVATATTIDGYNGNYYSKNKIGTSIVGLFYRGVVCSGQFIDTIINSAYIASQVKVNVATLLNSMQTSVPQSSAGLVLISNTIATALRGAPSIKGMFANSSVWSGANYPPNIKNGDIFPEGFAISYGSLQSQDQTDRQNRISPPFYVAIILAGGINVVIIAMNIQPYGG